MAVAHIARHTAVTPRGIPSWTIPGGISVGLLFLLASRLEQKWFLTLFLGSLVLTASLAFDKKAYYLALLVGSLPLGVDVNLYFHPSSVSHSTYGFLVRLSSVPLALLYLRWLAVCLTRKLPLRIATTGLFPLTGFFLSACVSLFFAKSFLFGAFDLFALALSIFLFVYAASEVRETKEVRLVLAVLIASVALQGVIALGQHVTESTLGLDFFGAFRNLQSAAGLETLSRVGGTFGHPNSLALYFDLLLPLSCSFLFYPMSGRRKCILAAVVGLGFAGLTLTLSRGGTIAVGLAVLTICIIRWRGRIGLLRGGLAAAVAGLSLAALIVGTANPLQKRLFEQDYGTASGRAPHVHVAWNIIRARPFFGVGLNNYTETAQQYDDTPERIISWWNSPVHNLFLFVAGETGLVGLSFFLAFLLTAVLSLRPALSCPDPLLASAGLGLLLGFMAYFVHVQIDYANWPHLSILWFLLGLAVSVGRLAATTQTGGRNLDG